MPKAFVLMNAELGSEDSIVSELNMESKKSTKFMVFMILSHR